MIKMSQKFLKTSLRLAKPARLFASDPKDKISSQNVKVNYTGVQPADFFSGYHTKTVMDGHKPTETTYGAERHNSNSQFNADQSGQNPGHPDAANKTGTAPEIKKENAERVYYNPKDYNLGEMDDSATVTEQKVESTANEQSTGAKDATAASPPNQTPRDPHINDKKPPTPATSSDKSQDKPQKSRNETQNEYKTTKNDDKDDRKNSDNRKEKSRNDDDDNSSDKDRKAEGEQKPRGRGRPAKSSKDSEDSGNKDSKSK